MGARLVEFYDELVTDLLRPSASELGRGGVGGNSGGGDAVVVERFGPCGATLRGAHAAQRRDGSDRGFYVSSFSSRGVGVD